MPSDNSVGISMHTDSNEHDANRLSRKKRIKVTINDNHHNNNNRNNVQRRHRQIFIAPTANSSSNIICSQSVIHPLECSNIHTTKWTGRERDREKEWARERASLCIHTYLYIYIYISCCELYKYVAEWIKWNGKASGPKCHNHSMRLFNLYPCWAPFSQPN